jgi:hypothetical protein
MNVGYVYHIGYLPEDRRESPRLDKLAAAYLKQARLGQVQLVQRRRGTHHYEYIVIPIKGGNDAQI